MRRTLVVVIDVEGEGLRFDATAENIGRKLAAADPDETGRVRGFPEGDSIHAMHKKAASRRPGTNGRP